ncbi:MAG: pseudouridine synthase, partial [Geobacteraceae bacterium]|nr:pseudouridine synthase [Geobacteraceae bacterium]
GVPLYKLARKGETVERAERTITVESLSIDSIALPDIAFTVRCSRGTYVRSLAADMGSALGTGAHLTALRRTSSGSFTIQDAVTIDDIVTSGPDLLSKGLMSIRCALAGLPELSLNEQGSRHVKNGIFPSDDDFEILPACWPDAGRVKLLFKGVLFAIGEPLPSDQRKIKLLRVFNLLSPLHSSV